MFCPSCGRQTPDGAQFCSSCGAYLTAPASPPAAPAASSGAAAAPVFAPPEPTTASGRRYGGFWLRFLAIIIDGILLQVASFILFLPVVILLGVTAASTGNFSDDLAGSAAMLFLFPLSILLNWLYEAGFTSSSKQATPGKMAVSLVVTDLAESRISFARASGRHFAKYLSSFTMLIGYLIQPFTEKRQALHDLLAGTLVVLK
jgi:uncharacterized RDD family membrane protein YckC